MTIVRKILAAAAVAGALAVLPISVIANDTQAAGGVAGRHHSGQGNWPLGQGNWPFQARTRSAPVSRLTAPTSTNHPQ